MVEHSDRDGDEDGGTQDDTDKEIDAPSLSERPADREQDHGLVIKDAIDRYLESKQIGKESGNYRAQSKSVLSNWHGRMQRLWAEQVTHLGDIDIESMLAYADYLKQRVDARRSDSDESAGITASTAQVYFSIVRAFLSWSIERGYYPGRRNPAAAEAVENALPDPINTPGKSEQFWTDEQRYALLSEVDQQARTAIDTAGLSPAAVAPARDRVLVYLLAFTGVRVGEVARHSQDARRTGLTWDDLDPEGNVLVVLGKSGDREEVPYPDQIHHPVKQLRRILGDPPADWPVLPTTDGPTVYRLAREAPAGVVTPPPDAETDSLSDWLDSRETKTADVLVRLAAAEVSVPALSVSGARTVLKRLCGDAEISPDGDADYLQPHGSRRSVGERLYIQNPALAQKVLRHDDISTTEQSYSHVEMGDVSDLLGSEMDPRKHDTEDKSDPDTSE